MKRYIDILNKEIQPALQAHGGWAEIRRVRNGILTIALYGACAGCPSADLETKSFIQDIYTSQCPEIEQV